jgi:hypothetical protein
VVTQDQGPQPFPVREEGHLKFQEAAVVQTTAHKANTTIVRGSITTILIRNLPLPTIIEAIRKVIDLRLTGAIATITTALLSTPLRREVTVRPTAVAAAELPVQEATVEREAVINSLF